MPGCRIADFLALVDQLPGTRHDHERYWRFEVSGRTFGYLWEPTRTVGLKQTIAEQLALVGERPEVFEVQFTSGGFGWVVVHLEGLERDELAELTFEAWRLTAPATLVEARADELPICGAGRLRRSRPRARCDGESAVRPRGRAGLRTRARA